MTKIRNTHKKKPIFLRKAWHYSLAILATVVTEVEVSLSYRGKKVFLKQWTKWSSQ